MQIGLLGFGTVGKGVYDLVAEQPGMEITAVLRRKITEIPGCHVTDNIDEIIANPDIDTIVEVIGGVEPAGEYVRKALRAGKNVVTANKALLAAKYDELLALAKESGARIRASASVGGSIGWLANLERANRAQKITHIHGIFNGTCNYMLDLMTRHGFTFDRVLKEAQDLGYAEADPSADIDGLDTAAKLVVSANVAFGISLNHESVAVAGIRNITAEDISTFENHGYVCKLFGTANYADGVAQAYVQPTLVRISAPEACVHTNSNLAVFEGSATGAQSFLGQGAGRYPTAYNILQDLCDLSAGKGFHTDSIPPTQVFAENHTEMCYYLRGSQSDLATWQADQIAHRWDQGIITTAQPVSQVHQWVLRHPSVFAAAVLK